MEFFSCFYVQGRGNFVGSLGDVIEVFVMLITVLLLNASPCCGGVGTYASILMSNGISGSNEPFVLGGHSAPSLSGLVIRQGKRGCECVTITSTSSSLPRDI